MQKCLGYLRLNAEVVLSGSLASTQSKKQHLLVSAARAFGMFKSSPSGKAIQSYGRSGKETAYLAS